jgi:Fe-S-cluster containining protein
MARFVCTRCGKCCISLGRHIRIERSQSAVQHYIRNAVSGDRVPVTVHPDHRLLYIGEEGDAAWCPFLRKDQAGPFVCTIYETRPQICRDFRCRTMVIYDREGNEAGHISGTTSLSTVDPVLGALWNDLLRTAGEDRDSRIETLRSGLLRHGYTLEPLS